MKYFISSAFCLLISTLSAQYFPVSPNAYDESGKRTGHWTLLYDSAFKKLVKDPDSVMYYRLIRFENGKPIGKVRDFYRTGRKQWEGFMSSILPDVPADGEVIYYHENGVVKETAIYKNGKLNGVSKGYDIYGNLISEGFYKDGEMNGLFKGKYGDGNGGYEIEMKGDKHNGSYKEFHPNGNPKISEIRKNGLTEGLSIRYYENGLMNSRANYVKGVRHGSWEWFNELGILEQSGEYENGNPSGNWIDYYEDGKTVMNTGRKDSLGAQGYWKYYHKNGLMKEEGVQVNGSTQGIWKYYRENGKLKEAGLRQMGKLQGEWRGYYDDGTLEYVIFYEADSANGPYISYHPNGKKKSEGSYKGDQKDGLWKYYDENETLTDDEVLDMGELNGPTRSFFPNGQVNVALNYLNGQKNGPFAVYHANGRISSKGTMADNLFEGLLENFYENGVKKDSAYCIKGLKNGISKSWYDTGQLASVVTYKDNKEEGLKMTYYPNGQLYEKYFYVNGLSEGQYENYHANGKKKHFGTNKNGQRHGTIRHWYENGNPMEVSTRLNGLTNGLVIFYDSASGKKSSKAYYLNGESHGSSIHYDTKGRKITVGQYANGKRNGKFTYYENGKKTLTEIYYNGFFESVYNIRDSVEKLIQYREYEKARAAITWADNVLKKNKQQNTIRAAVPLMLRSHLAYALKQMDEALAWNDKHIEIEKKYGGDTTNNYFTALGDRANILSSSAFKRYDEAAEFTKKGMEYDLRQGDFRDYSTGVFNQASNLAKAGKKQPEETFSEEIERMTSLKGPQHIAVFEIKNVQAYYYHFYLEDYEKSVAYYKKLIPDLEAQGNKEPRIVQMLSQCILNLADDLEWLNQNKEAIIWFKKYIEITEKEGIKDPDSYIKAHQRLGWIYSDIRQHDSAMFYYDKLLPQLQAAELNQTLWYANTLHGKANALYNDSRYEAAGKAWEEAKSVLESLHFTETMDYANVLSGYQALNRDLNNMPKAIETAQARLTLLKKLYGENGVTYLETYIQLGDLFRSADMSQRALETYNTAEKLIEQHKGTDSYLYADCQRSLGLLYFNLGEYKKAEVFTGKALAYFRTHIDQYADDLGYVLVDQAYNYRNQGLYSEAEKLTIESINLFEKTYGKESRAYLGRRAQLAHLYDYQGLYSQSLPIFLENLEVTRKIAGTEHASYISALRNVARCYYDNDEYKKAETYYTQFRDLARKTNGEVSEEYTDANYKLALIKDYTDEGDAEPLYKKTIALSESLYGEIHAQTAFYWKELGKFYNSEGRVIDAEMAFNKATTLLNQSIGTENPQYGFYLCYLANVKSTLSKNQEAEELLLNAYRLTYADRKINNAWYGDAAISLGTFYQKMGRYRDAEKIITEALQAMQANKQGWYYRKLMDQYIGLNLNWNKLERAAELGQSFLTLLEEDLAPTNGWITGTHNVLGLIYLDMNNVEEAEKHFKFCLDADKTLGRENSISYHNWSTILLEKGDFEGAEKALLKSVEIRGKQPNFLDLKQASVLLDNQAQLYQAWGKLDKAEKIWMQVIQNLKRYTDENFYFMSDEEKAQFWNDVRPTFEYFNTFAVLRSKESPAILGEMYNNQLATKAILLSTSNKIKNRLLNSRDAGMIAQYYHWIDTREKLAQLYVLSAEQIKNRKSEIDSLQFAANKIEKDLNITVDDLDKDRDKKVITWRDVQKQLGPTEAAVEIIRFKYFDRHERDSVLYAALVLTAETVQNPKLVVLPNGKYLEGRAMRFYKNSITNRLDEGLSYKTYWEPIEPLLKGKSRVYLSLDGVYNQISLNTLRDSQGKFLVDRTNFTLVSNTKDVIAMKSKKLTRSNANATASLFGFPKYFLGKDKLMELNKNQNRDIDLAKLDERDATGINELPGTLKEIEQVKTILNQHQIRATDFTHELASESAIKAVAYPSVLHIATHGFFIDDQSRSATFNLGTSTEYAERNPLLRSGLILSGASNFIQSNYKLDEENGILTAYEAANLNLENTELAVLSACETGTGAVQNGEGVYGLQRAFQSAGAKAILMSLWKVDDAATQELMTVFYERWMQGDSKTVAFRKAQLQLKTKYPHPYYWGAFVMMGE